MVSQMASLGGDGGQPGGGRQQDYDGDNVEKAPPGVRPHQLAATSEGYRRAALEHAIPLRAHGLFPPSDELLLQLAATPGAQPFEKHLSGVGGPYESLPKGGWATGDAAARSGVDLRLFYQERQAGEMHGSVQGAVRFGGGASIGNGFWMSAHGGAIETVLDEATAELAKMDFVPLVSTVEAAFKIKKAVPLHTSLLVQCRIKEQRGIRCWVEGQLCSADGQTVFATCEAQLVNLTNWL